MAERRAYAAAAAQRHYVMRQRLVLIAVLWCTGCSTPRLDQMPVRSKPLVWLDGQRLVIDEETGADGELYALPASVAVDHSMVIIEDAKRDGIEPVRLSLPSARAFDLSQVGSLPDEWQQKIVWFRGGAWYRATVRPFDERPWQLRAYQVWDGPVRNR